MHLGADIGGTKTNLALVADHAPQELLFEDHVSSRAFPDLVTMVRAFLNKSGLTARTACLAVPGPVFRGRAELTNLNWICVEKEIAQALGLQSVRLINDLVATALGIDLLPASDVVTLHAGTTVNEPELGQVRAVIAPGTGLGEAFCVHNGDAWLVRPGEGGHAAWAPRSLDDADLWNFLFERDGYVDVESVCSGTAVNNLWQWLSARQRGDEDPEISASILTAADPTRVIMDSIDISERCRLAVLAVVDHLANEACDVAVRLLPTGGIYLAGGLPPRLLPYLRSERFERRYLGHPTLGHVHHAVPVHVVLNPKAALLGTVANVPRVGL